ncbi:MAG: ferritin family protein [Dehalococcoidia bacterium]
MTIPFNADEILEIAEQIERNGARFYRRAAQGITDSGTREKLLDLAAMEEEHQKVFAAIRADLLPEEREPTIPDPWGEAALYLRGIADGHVFDVRTDPAGKLTGKETREDILRTAIGLEKDSIILYLGMREIVPERLGKGRIDAIIKEEMSHIATLSNQLAPSKRSSR